LEKEYGAALEAIGGMGPRVVIAQHSVRFDPGDRGGGLVRYRVVRQGDNALSLYREDTGPRMQANIRDGVST
jgi:hypothetical protein